MTLFDPHSHTTLFQLREEELTRKASRRHRLGLENALKDESNGSTANIVRALMGRLLRAHEASASRGGNPANQPALDS
jgi:hypothetical protein